MNSYLSNLGLFVFNNLILSILSVSALLVVADKHHQYGLFTVYSQPVKVLISFILFDLILYVWHRANHTFDCLWLFHKTHHSDKSVNVSTAFRVHVVEVLFTTVIKALFIVIAGIEASIVAFCEMVTTVFIMFHHTNIPVRNEKWLQWLFIVPSLHRVHHSEIRKEHDSNYGAVFSIWDRMFQTLKESRPVKVGLLNIKAFNFFELLKFSLFVDQVANRSFKRLKTEKVNQMIAEAAYYKAEKRGFTPGFEILDWIEAERQISEIDCKAF